MDSIYHGFQSRVYTRDDEIDTFYSTRSDAPLVDVGRHILEVQIYGNFDPKDGTVFSDSNNLYPLRNHHRLILEHIHYRMGAGNVTKPYVITIDPKTGEFQLLFPQFISLL